MWSEILGGLGAAGGGYAQALEKVKMQKLDEKTQREEQAWRDDESQRRTSEEQARIQAGLDRDVIDADRYTADQLAQAERDAATATERERALQFRIDEAQRDADAAAATLTHRGEIVGFEQQRLADNRADLDARRPPENHAIVAATRALHMTASDTGAWLPDAADRMLREGHPNAGESEEFIRALNYVIVREQEKAQERPELSPLDVLNMSDELQREYYLGVGGQQIDYGDTPSGDDPPGFALEGWDWQPTPTPPEDIVTTPAAGTPGAPIAMGPGGQGGPRGIGAGIMGDPGGNFGAQPWLKDAWPRVQQARGQGTPMGPTAAALQQFRGQGTPMGPMARYLSMPFRGDLTPSAPRATARNPPDTTGVSNLSTDEAQRELDALRLRYGVTGA